MFVYRIKFYHFLSYGSDNIMYVTHNFYLIMCNKISQLLSKCSVT